MSAVLTSKSLSERSIIPPRKIIFETLSDMVYYYTSNVVDPPATIYVGKDKFESKTSP